MALLLSSKKGYARVITLLYRHTSLHTEVPKQGHCTPNCSSTAVHKDGTELTMSSIGNPAPCMYQERTLESCLFFLKYSCTDSLASSEILMCIGTLLAHRRVAEKLSSPADMDVILSVPPTQHTAGAAPAATAASTQDRHVDSEGTVLQLLSYPKPRSSRQHYSCSCKNEACLADM